MAQGKNAGNQHFLLFPQCFLLNQIIVFLFVYIFHIISLFATELEEPKICLWGKVLNVTPKLEIVSESVENIITKWENAGSKHFLLFLRFWKPSA